MVRMSFLVKIEMVRNFYTIYPDGVVYHLDMFQYGFFMVKVVS